MDTREVLKTMGVAGPLTKLLDARPALDEESGYRVGDLSFHLAAGAGPHARASLPMRVGRELQFRLWRRLISCARALDSPPEAFEAAWGRSTHTATGVESYDAGHRLEDGAMMPYIRRGVVVGALELPVGELVCALWDDGADEIKTSWRLVLPADPLIVIWRP